MKKKSIGFWFLFVSVVFISVLLLKAWADVGDTPSGTEIRAVSTEAYIAFKDMADNQKPNVYASSTITNIVAPIYGITNFNETMEVQYSSGPSDIRYFPYYIYNGGNITDTFNVTTSAVSFFGGADSSSFQIDIVRIDTDEVVSSFTISEDGSDSFRIRIIPIEPIFDDFGVTFSARVFTPNGESFGDDGSDEYPGANGYLYSGKFEKFANTTTIISSAPAITFSRTATTDSPTPYIAQGGGQHDDVPGAVKTITNIWGNYGTGYVKDFIFIWKIPAYCELVGVNISGSGELANATINVARSNFIGSGTNTMPPMEIFTSTVTNPSFDYGARANWTLHGTMSASTIANDWATYASVNGGFTTLLNKNAIWAKAEAKGNILDDTKDITLTWSFAIR